MNLSPYYFALALSVSHFGSVHHDMVSVNYQPAPGPAGPVSGGRQVISLDDERKDFVYSRYHDLKRYVRLRKIAQDNHEHLGFFDWVVMDSQHLEGLRQQILNLANCDSKRAMVHHDTRTPEIWVEAAWLKIGASGPVTFSDKWKTVPGKDGLFLYSHG